MFSGTPTRSRIFAVGLAAAVAFSMALADDAQARTQRESFAGGAISFAGPGDGPANPYPSQIPVRFENGRRIVDVNLTLHGFTSNNPDDVAVMLAHGQTNQEVMADAGGTVDVAGVTFTLDDEAALRLPDTAQIVNGTSYKPARYGADWPAPAPSALSVFDGEDPNGPWRLFVVDDGFGPEPAAFNNGWTWTIRAELPR